MSYYKEMARRMLCITSQIILGIITFGALLIYAPWLIYWIISIIFVGAIIAMIWIVADLQMESDKYVKQLRNDAKELKKKKSEKP